MCPMGSNCKRHKAVAPLGKTNLKWGKPMPIKMHRTAMITTAIPIPILAEIDVTASAKKVGTTQFTKTSALIRIANDLISA